MDTQKTPPEGQGAKEQTPQEQSAQKNRSMKWKLINVGIVVLFLAGVVLLFRQYVLPPDLSYQAPTPHGTEAAPPAPAATVGEAVSTGLPAETPAGDLVEVPEATPVPRNIRVPAKIYFDDHRQSAPIIPVGVDEGGYMGAPDNASEAGWFYYSASPGDPGNSILDGHQAFGGKKGVFSVLKNAKLGETVIVEFEDGTLRYFELTSLETFLEEDVPPEYMTTGGATRLTLITCKGDYGLDGRSLSRIVAVCQEKRELRADNDPYIEEEQAEETPLQEDAT